MTSIPTNGHASPARIITGRQISKAKSKSERAKLAADLVEGRAVLGRLSIEQLARLCDVSQGYVETVLRVQRTRPDLIATMPDASVCQLAIAAGFHLADMWRAVPEQTRVETIREVGPDAVFDDVCRAVDGKGLRAPTLADLGLE
jgi:hypothetical protein